MRTCLCVSWRWINQPSSSGLETDGDFKKASNTYLVLHESIQFYRFHLSLTNVSKNQCFGEVFFIIILVDKQLHLVGKTRKILLKIHLHSIFQANEPNWDSFFDIIWRRSPIPLRVIRIFLMASPPALACSSFDKLVYITFQTYAYGTATGDSKIFKLAPKIKIPSFSTLTIFPIISMRNICFFN